MSGSLSTEQTVGYERDGYVCPVAVLSTEKAQHYRGMIEGLEREYPTGSLPRDVSHYFRTSAHMVVPMMAEIALEPSVLDAVESILGHDLVVWSSELFMKPAGSDKIVSWHQDLTYWGFGGIDDQVTAWIALSDVTPQSGCMRFVPGSHKQEIVPHSDTFAADNMLSRGQEIAVDVNEDEAVDIILKPGQMSLHHGRIFHASGPNTSEDRRIGVAIRYMTPGVRQMVGDRDYAMLARGVDRERNWIHFAQPRTNFEPENLEFYEEVLAERAKALAEGADKTVAMYSSEQNSVPV